MLLRDERPQLALLAPMTEKRKHLLKKYAFKQRKCNLARRATRIRFWEGKSYSMEYASTYRAGPGLERLTSGVVREVGPAWPCLPPPPAGTEQRLG